MGGIVVWGVDVGGTSKGNEGEHKWWSADGQQMCCVMRERMFVCVCVSVTDGERGRDSVCSGPSYVSTGPSRTCVNRVESKGEVRRGAR